MRWLLLIPALVWLSASPARAEVHERFWILWERFQYIGEHCPNDPRCEVRRNFTSRLFSDIDKDAMYRLFGLMDGRALSEGRLPEHPDAPRICQHNDSEVLLGFDPERLPKVEKIEVLRDLPGVYFDLRKLKAPPGESSTFGARVHQAFLSRFKAAGIKVLTEAELLQTPGQPTLNVYFSHTGDDDDDRCEYTYSVFASLSQTVLLSRNVRIKVSAGTWSFSARPTGRATGTEFGALVSVADALVKDYLAVNARPKTR